MKKTLWFLAMALALTALAGCDAAYSADPEAYDYALMGAADPAPGDEARFGAPPGDPGHVGAELDEPAPVEQDEGPGSDILHIEHPDPRPWRR
jgi:hypothetical protein